MTDTDHQALPPRDIPAWVRNALARATLGHEPLPERPFRVRPGQFWMAKDAPGILLVVHHIESAPDAWACCPIEDQTAYLTDRDIWLARGETPLPCKVIALAWLSVPVFPSGLHIYIGTLRDMYYLDAVERVGRRVPLTARDRTLIGPPLTGPDDPRYGWQSQVMRFWRPASRPVLEHLARAREER